MLASAQPDHDVRGSPRFRLRYRDGDVPVSQCGVVIGRALDCGLRLPGGYVSRHHARVRVAGDELVIEDLESKNGVFVNGVRIGGPTTLAHGDTIGIGVDAIQAVDDLALHYSAHLTTMSSPRPAHTSDIQVRSPDRPPPSTALLTDREREVLELVVLGHTQREIAQRLNVSVKTVETHRAHIAEKLDCHSRAELVSYAISAGMLRDALRGH